MDHTIRFTDWELEDLEGILIQPKRDGDGYTVHKIEKSKPDDGWDEWRSSIAESFSKAQENKKAIEELKSSLNRANDASDHWHREYLQTYKKVNDIQAELEEKNNQIEKLRNSCNYLSERSFWTELTFTATIEPVVDNGDPYEKFKAEFPELEITEVDFSDHQTLNNVFKKCFSIKRDRNPKNQKKFIKFIDAFERGATVFDNFGHFDLHWLMLFLIGESPTWLSDNHKELERYQWNKEHPFKYSINTIFDPETRVTEYYVVFNSAPYYRD